MKKQYKSPVILIEFFQLDAAVATAGCESSLGYAENECFLTDLPFFGGDCRVDVVNSDMSGDNTICYHGPFLANNVTYINS